MTYSWSTHGDNHIHISMGTHNGPAALDLPKLTLKEESKMTTATELVYTDRWDGFSRAIETAVYDADTKTLAVELTSGYVYAYDNVPAHVWNSFKGSISKGRFYAKTIKSEYGPGTPLYDYAVEDAEPRAYPAPDMTSTAAPVYNFNITNPATPKNLTYAEGAVVTNGPTTFNLQASLLKDTLPHTVRFTVDGGDVKSYRLEATDVTDAVAQVNGIADALDLEFKVTEVVTHFE